MIAVHRQKTRERLDYIRDTMMAAQAMPKDITKYLSELQGAIGDKPEAGPQKNDAAAFLAKNPKMRAASKPNAAPRKKG